MGFIYVFNKNDINNLIGLYVGGMSAKALAKHFNVSRQVICLRLRENNIPIRNRSESMYVRMAQTSLEERKRLAKKAQEARRGSPDSAAALRKKAIAAEKYLYKAGEFEPECFEYLCDAGFDPIPQKAVNKYNIDIAVGNVAVEIHVSTCNPLTKEYSRNKVIYLTNNGWNVIFVWISYRRNKILSRRACEDVVSFIKHSQANPSFVGQYRVIRGTGKFYSAGSLYGN